MNAGTKDRINELTRELDDSIADAMILSHHIMGKIDGCATMTVGRKVNKIISKLHELQDTVDELEIDVNGEGVVLLKSKSDLEAGL